MVAGVFVALGFQLVIWQLRTLADHARESDSRASAQALYLTQLTAYSTAVNSYQLCIDGVARSDQNRMQWEQLAGIVNELAGGEPYAEQIRNGPLLTTDARSIEDCPPAGDPPAPPGG